MGWIQKIKGHTFLSLVHKMHKKLYSGVYGKYIQLRYKTHAKVKVEGRVSLDSEHIVWGNDVILSAGVRIFGIGQVIIGDHVVIGDGTVICAAENVEIGSNTMIAAQCYITDCNHGMKLNEGPMRYQPMKVKKCNIGTDCWIGTGAKVLAGSDIQDGCVIGAGCVVDELCEKEMIFVQDRTMTKRKRR